MNKILSNIRSVPGVWGTLAIDKKRALTYQLLPARYDSQIVKDIAIPTLNLAQSSEKPMVVDFFFDSMVFMISLAFQILISPFCNNSSTTVSNISG